MARARARAVIPVGIVMACCTCAFALDPSLDISQYAHTPSQVRSRFSLGNTQENVPTRLPLIEGKDIRFTRYSTEQGLSESRVGSILQDRQGFMWFGTNNGLNRYDGYTFKIYKPEADNPNSLGGVFITALFEDRSGVLWVGVDQGLDRFDPVTQTFTHFRSNPNDPASLADHVEHIAQDRDGMLWLATRNGLDRLDPATGRFTHYRNDPNNPRSLSSDDVRYVLEDRQGTLWVSTATGLDAFDRRSGSVIRHYPSFQKASLDRIFEDRSGVLWAGSTRAGGIASLDRKTGQFTRYTWFDERSPSSYSRGCSAILEDQYGMLWLATTHDGLLKFDRRRRQFTRYRNDSSNPASLSGDVNVAFSLAEDREGGIWVGIDGGGVNRFSSAPSPFTVYRKEPGNPNSLDQSIVLSVLEDSERTLWIGTRQLNRLDRKTGRYTFYRRDPNDPGGIGNGEVFATVEDRSGILWFGMWKGGLNRFDRKTGRFKVYRHNPADPRSLSNDNVLTLYIDHAGNLWVGTEDGVNRFDPATERFTVYRDSQDPAPSRIYRVMTEDPDGSIWLGTYEWGLQRLDVRTGKIVIFGNDPKVKGSLSSNRVNALCVDKLGQLWVGTQNGLNRYDPRTGQFAVLNEHDGLPDNAVQGILEDARGNLWLSTGNGLSKFNPRAKTFKNYYAEDGLAGNEFNNFSVYFKSADGEMFFGGINGVTTFYPDRVVDNPFVPPVVLTDFRLSNNPVNVGTNSVLRKSISFTDALTLSHTQSIFSFEFSGLSYASPQRNRYRYMLQPLETRWNEVGSDHRFVTYTTLPPGRYVFRVQGSSSTGVWNLNGVSVAVTILPPWYQTLWFRVLIGAAFLLFLWAIYKVRVHQLQEQEKKFREAVETMPALAFVAESLGSRSFVNRAWLEYTGLTLQEATGSGWEKACHPDDRKRVMERWRAAQSTGQLLEYEVRVRRGSDGAYRWFQTRARPLFDRHHKVVKWCAVATDIEDRKRAEQLQSDLAHVNRISTLGELAASISHELKQPIAASIISAETVRNWLDRDPPNVVKARERANMIIEAGNLAAEIIDRLRSLYKKTPPKREPIAVNDVIRDIVALLLYQAGGHGVSLRTDLATTLPLVVADRVQIQQVLMNLMLNGIEAMSETGGVLTVRADIRADGQIEISVNDTGPGLPPGKAEQIFDAFFTTKPQGSGMGLAISRSIVESHGGRIWATGDAGHGATFHFTLPSAPVEAEIPVVAT